MKRVAQALLIAGWTAAVCCYWRENVPLVPTKSVQIPSDRAFGFLSSTSELAVYRRIQSGTKCRLMGPIEFWSFPDLKIVRRVLLDTDEIVSFPDAKAGEILIRRSGLQLRHLYSDALLTTLPGLEGIRTFRIVPGRPQILIESKAGIQLFEFGKEQPVWTSPGNRLSSDVTSNLLVVKAYSTFLAPSLRIPGALVLDVATGKIDSRFDHVGIARKIQLSPDGRLALVSVRSGPLIVCDASTGRELWRIAKPPSNNNWWFSATGEEIQSDRMDGELTTLLRRRSSDGTWLTPLSERDLRSGSIQTTPERQFALTIANTRPPQFLWQWFNQAGWLPADWQSRLYQSLRGHRYRIIDHRTDRLIGSLPDNVAPMALKDNIGFATFTPGRLTHYGLPLRRNWLWLAGWLLVPPISVIVLARGRRCYRERRLAITHSQPES